MESPYDLSFVAKDQWILALGFDRSYWGLRLTYKVIDNISYSREAVYTAQFDINAFPAQAIAHGRTRFNGVELNTHGGQFIRRASKGVRTLHVHDRRS